LQEAEEAQGLIRRHAILRAVLGLRDRPDAARELLRRAGAGGLASRVARAILDRLDEDSLAGLRVRVASGDRGEAQVRRAFALASRDAGLLPR
jgi:hypothetical protein